MQGQPGSSRPQSLSTVVTARQLTDTLKVEHMERMYCNPGLPPVRRKDAAKSW